MVARLDRAVPLPKIPERTIIRSLRQDEEKRLFDIVNLVFGWERLKPGFIHQSKIDSPPFAEEWIHVAEVDDKIISAVVAWPATKFNKIFRGKRGYLGPAATLPEFRGKNLASALTRRAMNFLFGKGVDTLALHTQETSIPSVTLLRSLGFEIDHHWKFMRKTMPPRR